MSATCHQREWENAHFGIQEQPIKYWKQFLRVEQKYCLEEIKQGLLEADLHPPLYFWLLHFWSLPVGIHEWTGLLLNTIFSAISFALLFQFSKLIFNNIWENILVVGSFALNPATILVSLEARHYELLALCSLLLIFLTTKYVLGKATPSVSSLVWLSLVSLAGTLTHYYFLFPFSASLVIFLWAGYREKDWQIIKMPAVMLIGYLIAGLLFPFWVQLQNRTPHISNQPTLYNFLDRVTRALLSVSSFYYILIPLGLTAIYLILSKRRKLRFNEIPSFNQWRTYLPLFYLVWIAGTQYLSFFLFLTPRHAVGVPKYLSMLWFLLAFLPVYLLRWTQYRKSILLYLCLIPILYATIFPFVWQNFDSKVTPIPYHQYDRVILDNVERGNVLPQIWQMPDDTNIIIAQQKEILQELNINNSLLNGKSLYLHVPTEGEESDYTRQIFTLLEQKCQVNVAEITRIADSEAEIICP